MVDVFSEGYKKTAEEIKSAQQSALEEENYLIDEIPENCSLVNITMRIPGQIKNNRYISRVFNLVVERFRQKYKIIKEVLWDLSTGPQAFLIIEKDPGILKQETIEYEASDPLGLISDVNVFAVEDDQVSPITRKELGLPDRKCIIDDKSAKECKKDQNHSLAEMYQKIDKIINDNVEF
ncbi:citrate lyase holo-[acyl-carrier protein] synthase [Companilactobacillus furfuricola]|uniref:citrate lyase holo-[acyl-carrier protein] synthase n=1 Tax=Companilactobacillus furfuricola TaxID=1462575 RepID=UPI000F7718D3|nr:citrate lyase holo-[acyl-carrier protein] synthase [Companilactobacillus furfuricola]